MTFVLVPRSDIGLDPVVRSSSGAPRPAIRWCRYITAHWPGVDVGYGDEGDTAAEIRAVERYAAGASKPNEYNYVIGQDPDDCVYEYAGAYRSAHSEGENDTAVGVLFLNGINEPINARQIEKARWLRDVLRYFGIVDGDPHYTPHSAMPGAATQCPGPTIRASIGAMSVPWVEPTPPTPPTPTPPSTSTALLTAAQSGDGWYAIARRVYGSANVAGNVARLQAANPGKALHPGVLVNVPGRAV